jgi:glycosyltransferase involved in cell wall biosynthesis
VARHRTHASLPATNDHPEPLPIVKKVLLGCFEVPGWGGLTTATYQLFELMQNAGLDVLYLNLIPERYVEFFKQRFGPSYGNPRGLRNVHHQILTDDVIDPQPALSETLEALAPDAVVGVGDFAAYVMKRASPKRRLIFLTSGCQQVSKVSPFSAQEGRIEETREMPPIVHSQEQAAVIFSDLIVTHSDMTRSVYLHFYPDHAHKIHEEVIWFAEWIHQDAARHGDAIRPFEKRDIDALFVANTWSREEKNYALVKALAPRLDGLSVHLVGEVPERVPGITYHGLIGERAKLFDLMGRTRTVVSPSLFDAAPGILFEGSAMGCNVVASRNCGNWFLCNEALLAEPFTVDTFVEKIGLGRTRKMPDNMDRFFRFQSYDKWIRLLRSA